MRLPRPDNQPDREKSRSGSRRATYVCPECGDTDPQPFYCDHGDHLQLAQIQRRPDDKQERTHFYR